ncbi:MAG TPA: 4Fe-4S dicluster domain-containing protein [Chloroflexi bacterium]|nr:4Fe-4S dicluster domain-containing protein [Chloroflexota bacterium]
MANLSVEICGLMFKNPVLPAAGPPTWNGAVMVACAEGGAGGIVAKTISTTAAVVPEPCMAQVDRNSMLNTELWSELPPEQFLETEYAQAKETGLPLIISMGYTAEQIAELAPRVKPFADALELSTHYIGEDPAPMVAAIQAAKDAVDVPIIVKLSPLGREMKTAAEAAQKAGADAIAAINSFGPCLGIDVETGLPLMGSEEGYGWLSGQAIKPLALRCVFDIARAVDLPIFGVGGVSSGIDAIEMFMVGASAVQVCTAAILKGPAVLGKIAREMDAWLDDHGYASVADVQGLTIRRVRERAYRTTHLPPSLDRDLCTGCGLCETSCVYHAIAVVDGLAELDQDLCQGCGLCVTRCPVGALEMP